MKLRPFLYPNDLSQVDTIFRHQPELGVPSLSHIYDNAVVENGDARLIAYGVLKEYAEAVLILDRTSTRKREKAEAVKLVVNRAIASCQKLGLEKLVIVSNDPSYTKVLEKRYGFKEVGGKTLFLEIG